MTSSVSSSTPVSQPRGLRAALTSDVGILIIIAAVSVILHTVTNGLYGFHRDELGLLDDARYLGWGYVSYPPFTPLIARLSLTLFGLWGPGIRFFPTLALGIVIVLSGLMARDFGGGRGAQVVAAIAVAISPVVMIGNQMLHYLSFDYLWWVVVAACVVRLLRTENPRWWLGVGAGVGLGMMTKYTMAFLAVGLVVGLLLTPARRYLRTIWPWAGAGLALLIFLPNLIWQVQHSFISLQFLAGIHARDIAWGRTSGYLIEQLYASVNPFVLPFVVMGLWFTFFSAQSRRFRMIGWMWLTVAVLLFLSQGRSYYLAPAYPMLIAAGATWGEGWIHGLAPSWLKIARGAVVALLILGTIFAIVLLLPIAPVNSGLWKVTSQVNDNIREMVGWPELVQSVAQVYNGLPPEEKAHAAIFAGNYGELGAINLLGPEYGLPEAISGGNSSRYRDYGNTAPETVVAIGFTRSFLLKDYGSCETGGWLANPTNVVNEESQFHSEILVCREPRQSWQAIRESLQQFQ
ncbi:MAG: glycosyltransferase family 39 protein [Anaerolineae bacterium]